MYILNFHFFKTVLVLRGPLNFDITFHKLVSFSKKKPDMKFEVYTVQFREHCHIYNIESFTL